MTGIWKKAAACLAALLMLSCAAVLPNGVEGSSALADGALAPLQVRLTSDEVIRGDFLEIQVENIQDYAQYAYFGEYKQLTAYVSTPGFEGDAYQSNPWGYIRIPTQNLNPRDLDPEEGGRFTVMVTAGDREGNIVQEALQFTVTEPDGDLIFRASASQVVTGETYYLTAYAPGATRIEVYNIYDELKFSTEGYNEDYAADRGKWSDGYPFRGRSSYWAKAYFYDGNTDSETYIVSDTLTVDITAAEDIPAIDVEMDPVLTAGGDLVMHVPATDVYSSWNLRVLRRKDNAEIIHTYRDEYNQATGASTAPGTAYDIRVSTKKVHTEEDGEGNPVQWTEYILEPGEAYQIQLAFSYYNKHGFSYSVPLLVVGADTVSDAVEMTVNGQKGTLHAQAHANLHYQAKGPENATGLLIFAGHDWEFHEGNAWSQDWGWWTLNHIPEFLFYAKYTTDPLPVGEYDWRTDLTFADTVSNVVRVVNDTKGYLTAPEFTVNTTPGADGTGEITRGSFLEITVENLSDYSAEQEVTFFATVFDRQSGMDLCGRIYGDGMAPIRVPTACIDPADWQEALTVDLTATTTAGWYQTTTETLFRVVEPADQAAVFGVSPAEVATGEDYTVSLYAPGAAEYRIYINGEYDWIWRDGNGAAMAETFNDGQAARKTYEAQVRYADSAEWTTVGTAELLITAPEGDLPEITLNAPLSLAEGEDLVLSWSGTEDVDNVDLRVVRAADGEGVWHAWGTSHTFTVSAVQPAEAFHMETLHAPGEQVLEADTDYVYRVEIRKRGFEGVTLSGRVLVTGENTQQKPGEITLKLNGSTEFIQSFVSLTETSLTVEAPGATGIRFIDPARLNGRTEPEDDDWEYFARDQFTDVLALTWRFWPNSRYMYAQARYDDYEDIRDRKNGENPWTKTSNDIYLNITSNGKRFPDPKVSLSAATAERGSWITASITEQLGLGEWYWADLGAETDHGFEGMEYFDFNGEDAISINTAPLEAGTYSLYVWSAAEGYAENGETKLSFTVTGDAPAAFLELSSDAAVTCEDVSLYVYAPDTDRVFLEVARSGDPSWSDWRDWDLEGDSVHEMYGIAEPGVYTLTARNAETSAVIGSAQTLTVTAPEGPLSKPDLSALAGQITAGQAFIGSFTVDAHAEWLDINVDYLADDGERRQVAYRWQEMGDADWAEVSIPADALANPGVYIIDVNAKARGYVSAFNRISFIVAPAGSAAAVSLKVNGDTKDIDSWPSATNLRFTAEADGATALRLLWNNDYWDCQDAVNGRANWDYGPGSGDYAVVAQMTTDEPRWRADDFDWRSFDWNSLNWSTCSNVIRVHVTAQGTLSAPDVILSPAGDTFGRGEILTVTAAPQAHAEGIWAEMQTLREENGGRWLETVENGYFDSNGTMSVQIPTYPFAAGAYYLKVGVGGAGYDSGETYLPITLTEPSRPPEPAIIFSRDTMRANEGLTVTGMAPGAVRMELDVTWDRDPNWHDRRGSGRDFESWGWGCGCGGEYTFTLYYWMPEEADPRSVSSPLTVHSDGALEAPELTDVPAILYIGSGINGSFNAIEGTEWYNVGIQYSENGWDWQDLMNEDREAGDPDATQLVFGSEMFSRAGSYQIWVSANAVGKDNGYREADILVVDPAAVTENLKLRVETEEIQDGIPTAYLHQYVHAVVDAPENVTAVMVRTTHEDWNLRLAYDDAFDWWIGAHSGGEDVFIAKATTDRAILDWLDTHGNFDEFDFNSVAWTMYSEPVTVNVVYYGDLDAPQVEFPNGQTIRYMEDLSLTIHPVEHAYSYGVQIRRADDDEWDWLVDEDYPLTETTTVQVDTFFLDPGDYIVQIDPRCYGWHGDSIGYPFTVKTPEHELEDVDAVIEKTTVKRGEQLKITVRNQNAGLNASYGAHLVSPGADFSDFEWAGADENQVIWLDTLNVPAGSYDVIVSATAVDCYAKIARIPVTIEARQASNILTLPSGLKTVSEEAFAGVAAEKIIVPAGVTRIEARAFADCPNLFELELPAGVDIDPSALEGCGTVFIYGPAWSQLEELADGVDNLYFIPVT